MKNVFIYAIIIGSALVLAGCNGSGNANKSDTSGTNGSFLRSLDGGTTWQLKTKINDKKDITAANVLSIAVSPSDSQMVYLGAEKEGLLVTHDGVETWEQTVFTAGKVYGLAIDNGNPQVVYVSGVSQKRGKIYKSLDGGANWKEIYTEPSINTVISSLEIDNKNTSVLYAGTSEGVILKSIDGGQSWINEYKAEGPVIDISFDAVDDSVVYFGVFDEGIVRTKNAGDSFDDLTKNLNPLASNAQVVSVTTDPKQSGILYVGLEKGIVRGKSFGDTWEKVNVIESSTNFPVRAIAVNPQNSNEIIYSAAQAIYKSIDGGVQWSTFQLATDRIVEVLKYNPQNPSIIYAGLRKI